MATRKVDPIQKAKDLIIKLPDEAQDRLYTWLTAVRDVNIENARRKAKEPVADKPKEDSKS